MARSTAGIWKSASCTSQVDVLFAQIQGSARIRLEDGTILRVNYDSHNGWPYTPVGRVLVERKFLTKDEVSMQSIRDWMEANPDAGQGRAPAEQVLRFLPHHRSCHRGRSGRRRGRAAGARPLDRGRSFAACLRHAVLHRRRSCRSPTRKAATKFRRLVFAQDTGSAIVGPARADIYFGAGDEAARIAGRIKNPGDFVMLLPRELDPVEAARDMPLPPERAGLLRAVQRLGTMDDPTAEDVPLPEPRPCRRRPRPTSASRKPRRGRKNEPPPPFERRRARAVDRLCALDQAVAARQTTSVEPSRQPRTTRAASTAAAARRVARQRGR